MVCGFGGVWVLFFCLCFGVFLAKFSGFFQVDCLVPFVYSRRIGCLFPIRLVSIPTLNS